MKRDRRGSNKSRVEKYRLDLSVMKVEKNAMDEEVTFLKYTVIKNIEAEKSSSLRPALSPLKNCSMSRKLS